MNAKRRILHPPHWPRPQGYVNGIAAQGTTVFIAGQIGWRADESGIYRIQAPDFVGQAVQALQNVLTILAEADGKAEHITRMNWYVVDKREYRQSWKTLGVAYRQLMGSHYPAMTAVEVAALIEDDAKVEIEATAVIPE